ncbi:MAG: hypothetical protein ACYDIA_19190 [Candidatus Humimicrobiaceae bacterium]
MLERRYWDSVCFLKWLKKEPDYECCKGVIHKAETGEMEIITSAITIAEVIILKDHEKINRTMSMRFVDILNKNIL